MLAADGQPSFCCHGCLQAHNILHSWGLSGYYTLRDVQGGQGVPARVSGRQFLEMDDPALAGNEVTTSPRGTCRASLYLEGVHCAACVWLIETMPRAVPGLLSVRVNIASGVAEAEWDPGRVALSTIAKTFDRVGYPPHLARTETLVNARRMEERSLLVKTGVAAACAMNVMFIHLALYAGEGSDISADFERFFRVVSLLVTLPVMFYSARPFLVSAWAGVRQRVPRIDIPLSLALIIAFSASAFAVVVGHGPVYFDSLSGLVALLLGARYLQFRAQRLALERTVVMRNAAFAEYARRMDQSGCSVEVAVTTLRPGDHVEVLSGELVPVDGVVTVGRSSVDLSMLTGETDAVGVGPGDRVLAGSSNVGARLVVAVEAAGLDTRVGSLLRLVDDAMGKRSALVDRTDRLSRAFVTVVLAGALTLAVGTLLATGDMARAITQMVALLVVTCPCGLALAAPVTLTSALSRAANLGIFIKNPDVFELCQGVDTLLLDKTGTLTEGTTRVLTREGEPSALALAAALEAESVHPAAVAIRRSVAPVVRAVHAVEAVQEVPGKGISGSVDGHSVVVGNEAMLAECGVCVPGPWQGKAAALLTLGQSPVFASVDGSVDGIFGLTDPVRPEARTLLNLLKKRGVRPHVVSGDHPEIVLRVADELGILRSDAHGGMSPEDKRDMVAGLTARPGGRRVMMVGDGVNDAAALALADIGVVMHGGSGASVVAADVVLTRPGLQPVVDLWTGSHRVLGVLRRNMGLSLAYNAVAAGLTVAGLVGPLLAAVLMPASSVTVILSSLLGRTFVKGR
jgi:Cu2+-exporting ATPase